MTANAFSKRAYLSLESSVATPPLLPLLNEYLHNLHVVVCHLLEEILELLQRDLFIAVHIDKLEPIRVGDLIDAWAICHPLSELIFGQDIVVVQVKSVKELVEFLDTF